MEMTKSSMKYKQHMMLCGYFSIAPAKERGNLGTAGVWHERTVPEKSAGPYADSKESYRKYYYPEFVRFCFDNCRRMDLALEPLHEVLERSDSKIPFTVDGVTLLEYPNDIAMFAISVRCESDNINDFTALGLRLRGVGEVAAALPEFSTRVLNPILEAMALLRNTTEVSASDMVELGNKMKIFQVVESDRPIEQDRAENILFALGSLSRYSELDENSGFSNSYKADIIKSSKISIFRNWSALSLFDTFTLLAWDPPAWQPEMWISDYFFMLYLYAVYYKFYLQRLNMKFFSHPEQVESLTVDYEEFEIHSNFTYLSYNFLPNELTAAMMKSLDIEREREKVTSTLMRESKRVEAANDSRLNRFLTFLTILTVFSTIWDFCCLLEKITGFETSLGPSSGYSLVASLAISVVVLCILLIIRKSNRK